MEKESYDNMRIWLKKVGFILAAMVIIIKPARAQDISKDNGNSFYAKASERFPNIIIPQDGKVPAALKRAVSLHYESMSLKEALQDIAQKTGFRLVYNDQRVPLEKKITLNLNGVTINEALLKILKGTGLQYALSANKNLVLIERHAPSLQVVQETITGTVTDAQSGETLPGVNILVKGTSNGTSTDTSGHYELSVPSLQDTLVFSFIGYQTREVPLNGQTTLNVRLKTQAISGEEVVVVGYGTQKKENITGAVSTIDYDKNLKNTPVTNASQALAGKVAGVWVSQNSGEPGSDGATLRIRGFGTLNNNNPLILIDGVEGQLSDINPQDIASINVLKDAASAAIYGSRAANGVVLVTTKKGAYNSSPQLEYNGYVGFQKLGRRYDIIDNSVTFMQLWNQAVVNDGGTPLFSNEVISAFKNGEDPYKYPNTNFFDEVFQTAPMTEHNISVSGGSENQRYYLSANYMDQDGIIKQTSSQRFGVNFNLHSKINNWMEIGGQIKFTRKITDRPYNNIDRVMYIMSNGGYPFIAPYTRDGKFGATQAVYMSGNNQGQPIVDSRNPLPDLYNGLTGYKNNYLKGGITAVFDITNNLNIRSRYSGHYNSNNRERWNELNYVFTDGGFRNTTLDYPTTITNSRNQTNEYYWTFYNTINYDKNFAGIHEVTFLGGIQFQERQSNNLYGEKSNPPKEGLHQIDAATSNTLANGNATKWRMVSYFGRINYNFKEKYLLQSNLRADASSRFREGNQLGLFPSFSLGWRISNEPFMDELNFISNLKLRASWGRLGNQNIGSDFPYLATITQSNGTSYNLKGQLVPGAAKTELVDKNISWETTETTDIGLSADILNSKLGLGFDYFYKKTKDILVRLPIPETLGGVSPPIQNVGKMKNEGFEVSASYNSTLNKNFNYHVGLNLTHVKNQVVSFRGGNSPDQLYLIREGVSYKALYGYKTLGIYQTDEEANQYMSNNSFVPSAGDVKYEDVNNDGKLNFKDKMPLGNTIPKFTYGLSMGISYKNINFDLVAQGIAQVHAYTQNAWTEPLGISGATITKRWKNAWTPNNKSSTLPRIRINDPWNRKQSSFWVTNLSYFKIKNVQLSYNIPNKWINDYGIGNLKLYLNVRNLHTWVTDDYEGFDPERSTFNSGSGQYPTAIITTFGVNIQF